MPKLPILKPREVVSILTQLAFAEVRQRGYHKQFRHPDGCVTRAVPLRQRHLTHNLLRKIIEDIRLTPDEFLKLFQPRPNSR